MFIQFKNRKTLNITDAAKRMLYVRQNRIPLSNQITGIELRMLPPLIKNNKTIAVWPFKGYASVYCLTIVLSDVANQLSGHMDLHAFPGISDKEYLPINRTVFYCECSKTTAVPRQVHIMSSIIKSRQPLRNVADILAQVKDDNSYKSILAKLSEFIPHNGSFYTLTEMSMEIAGTVGRYLGRVHDIPLGTIVNSFTALHGDWDQSGITPVQINTKNVDFFFELIVRDTTRAASMGNDGTVRMDLTPL